MIGEVSLAVVLLAGAGVMIRSVLMVATADLGVNTANVLTGLVGLPKGRYPDAEAQVAVVQELTARVKAMPGVESVAIASALPAGAVFQPSKRAYELGSESTGCRHWSAFDGRDRDCQRGLLRDPSCVGASRSSVHGGRRGLGCAGRRRQSAVRDRIMAWRGSRRETASLVQRRLAGVMAYRRRSGVEHRARRPNWTTVDPVVYRPFQQEPETILWVLARTRVPPESVATAFRRGIEAIDADIMVGPGNSGIASPLDELLKNNYRANEVNGVLFLIFAAVALLLASAGLYAVVAHSVSQRTQEIGIRSALGASAADILTLVMKEGMLPVSIGLLTGLIAALAVTPVLKSQLVNVSPTDPAALIAASATLIGAATLGCWIPARRAVRVDPVVALRHE